MIHITDSQTDKILDTIPLGEFWDDNHHRSLKDTLEIFDFKTFGDKRYSEHLAKMNRVIIPDEDGTNTEFVIDNTFKYRNNSTLVTEVYASASYLLLKKAKVIKPQKVVGYTGSQHLGFALSGTEWRPGIVESDNIRTIEIENYTNPYAYIKKIASELNLEIRFRIEDDGQKVIGRYVDLLERVGQWRGREVEFGRDLLGIERKVDDSNIVTALIGLGPEQEDGTRLEVLVEDEDALQRWGRKNPQTSELMHLIEVYEPESFDPDMTIERLTELTRNELEKRINSVVEYTADVADLEKVPGMENKVIRFGDTIKIKDTGFNPPLYLEARVHTQDRSLSQPEKKKVILGDYIEYTEEEVHAIWRQLQTQIKEKISAHELYDYTYAKPVIDSKDEAVRSDVESYANTVSANAKDAAITYTNNTVNPIIVRVDDIEEDIANHENRISQAQTDIIQAFNEINLRATKTELDIVSDQVNNVIGEINVLAGQIELKVDVDGVISAINLSQEVVKISADRIEFEGHVFGENATFTGKIEGAEISTTLLLTGNIQGSGRITLTESAHNPNEYFIGEFSGSGVTLSDNYGLTKSILSRHYLYIGSQEGIRISPSEIRFENNELYPPDVRLFMDFNTSTPQLVFESTYHTENRADLRIRNGNMYVHGNTFFYSPNRQIVMYESDNGNKEWHIEVNNGQFNIVETNIANRLSIDNQGTLYVSNDFIFGNNTGRLVNDGGYGYLQTNNSEYRVTKFKSTTYIPIRAASFPSGSLAEFKTNIEKWDGVALDVIRNADIYKYQLKSDIEDGKEIIRYGLVIGDGYKTPEEVIDEDGIEQYAMNSIGWKAIQELDAEQQELKERVSWLETENHYLKQKIRQLEELIA